MLLRAFSFPQCRGETDHAAGNATSFADSAVFSVAAYCLSSSNQAVKDRAQASHDSHTYLGTTVF